MPSKKDADISDKQKIKELSEENKRLRREVDALKFELEDIQQKKAIRGGHDDVRSAFDNQSLHSRLYSKRSYTSYLLGLISSTSVFRLYRKMIAFVKRYTFISTTLKILAYILTVLQSGTIFVLAASFFVVSLPFTFIVGYTALVVAFFGNRRLKKKMSGLTRGKNITVLFPQKGRAFSESSYFAGMARDIAKDGENTVVIVSPYFFSSKGISGSKKLFIAMREEGDNILIIKRHYFFTFKRQILKKHAEKITYIY
ncbi:MAG: hypothetical protein IJ038_00330 [Clostridia bacterium]|nr:hypothetical protein [Clostridia bacterium]